VHSYREKRVLILYNEPLPHATESEMGVIQEVEAVRWAMESLGIDHQVKAVQGIEDVLDALEEPPGIVFNMVESLGGDPISYCLVPKVCESMGWPVTGSCTSALLKTTHKPLCKAILRAHGIPTPNWQLVGNGDRLKGFKANGAIILKPASYHGSEGIDAERNLITAPYLEERVIQLARELDKRFKFGIMAEEFVGDREINVTVLERDGLIQVLELAEIDFSALPEGYPRVLDYKAKWVENSSVYQLTPRMIPAPLDHHVSEEIRRIALRCFEIFGCNDYMRVDFRLKGERAYVIDVNTNPDVSLSGGLAATLFASEISYEGFIAQVIENARKRDQLNPKRT